MMVDLGPIGRLVIEPTAAQTQEFIRQVQQGMAPPGVNTREVIYPDDRFDWVEITTFGGGEEYITIRCRHTETVPVESCVDGEILAHLCLTCDRQLGPRHGNS